MKPNRFNYWIWFGLVLTALPLIVAVWIVIGESAQETTIIVAFKGVISRGELLLVCLSILGANLGDLFKDECLNKNLGLMLKALSFILSLLAISSFGVINTNSNFSKDIIWTTSVWMFYCSVAICLVSSFSPRKRD